MAGKSQAPKPEPTSVEVELGALETIVKEMKRLDDASKMRVFGYLASRFNLYVRSE